MSEKPQTVALGAFIVGAILVFIMVLLYLMGTGFGRGEKVIMVFDGSVKGLNVGAPVALRGVQTGEVTKIDLLLDTATAEVLMVVEAQFNPDRIKIRGEDNEDMTEELLARGLRAQLNTQSLLTGLLYVQLDFFPNTELVFRDVDSPYFQFPTIPTELERITRALEELDIAGIVDNFDSITANVEALINNPVLDEIPGELSSALNSLTELSEQLQNQLASTGPRLDDLLDGAGETVSSANQELPQITELVRSNLETLDAAVAEVQNSMKGIDKRLSDDSGTVYRLEQAMIEVSRAARALQSLASTLQEQPEALIRGRSEDTQ